MLKPWTRKREYLDNEKNIFSERESIFQNFKELAFGEI